MSSIERFDVGARLSEMAVHNGTIHLAGQVPAAIDALLARAGSDKSKILMAQIFVADMAEFAAMNSVWDAWVVPGHTPPRATVQARLGKPEWKVEIVVTAAV
jgi:enamine deaminase RidA (YjgF/YER057c/UK114 family)